MKTVLITGASRGLGLELSKIFLANNYKVIACSRNIEQAKIIFGQKDNLHLFELDLENDKTINNLKNNIERGVIEVDILINCAAVYLEKNLEFTQLSNIDLALIEKSMLINFYAPLKLIRILIEHMKQKKSGKIINVSSAWGTYDLTATIKDNGVSSAYRLSKNILNYLTFLLSDELKDYKDIEINAVCPGWMKTDMGGIGASKSPITSAEEIFYLLTNNIGSGKFYKGTELSEW
ncbi:SDR family NAD(P)-dependent oxidoreductase [Aliarcobacter butzleri]|uniref:SDR family NAD(P)-dependent oxidoreductase n=1 Tax=Aliarcobacter butzleri TaxID=28197 RepID=UPI00126079F2|nr:SDR family NAD(P)-dependent oxidoreductase [Aliarcobacter butzleri]